MDLTATVLASSSDLALEPAGLILGSGAEVPQVTATLSDQPRASHGRLETRQPPQHGVRSCSWRPQGRAPPIKGWLWATRAAGHL